MNETDPNPKKTEVKQPDERAHASRARTAEREAPEPVVPNLTRDSIELQLAARYESEGKSREEAQKLAKARALEMCP